MHKILYISGCALALTAALAYVSCQGTHDGVRRLSDERLDGMIKDEQRAGENREFLDELNAEKRWRQWVPGWVDGRKGI